MLQKSKRLNLHQSFSWVRSSQKSGSDLFMIFYRLGDNTGAKVGIALKKESFKKAVDRNRARRLTSKAFENIYEDLPKNLNIVVMPKKGVLKKSSDELTEHLKKELIKLDDLK